MATIGTASHANYLNTPRRSYITTTTFQNDIFRYTTTTDPNTFAVTGTLTSLGSLGTGTSANCPANRILVENGKKLYPSGLYVANNTTYSAPNPGVTTYMVGVYDPASFLSGFIDPNSKVFAPYNTDKPDYVPRGINPNGNTEVDQGPPVYTLGSVTAGTTITAGTGLTVTSGGATITAGGLTVTSGDVNVASGNLRSSTVTSSITATGTLTINPALGNTFIFTANLSGNVTLEAATGTAAAYKGAVINILFLDPGGRNITFGTDMVGNNVTAATDNKWYSITMVSDGTNFRQLTALQQA